MKLEDKREKQRREEKCFNVTNENIMPKGNFLFNLPFQGKNEQRIPMLKLFSEDAMSVMLSAAQ